MVKKDVGGSNEICRRVKCRTSYSLAKPISPHLEKVERVPSPDDCEVCLRSTTTVIVGTTFSAEEFRRSRVFSPLFCVRSGSHRLSGPLLLEELAKFWYMFHRNVYDFHGPVNGGTLGDETER